MQKILVVDDASTVRMYFRTILESEGFEVDEAVNGLEALEKAYSKEYDLFLVDINMPQMDGYSFVRKLREGKDLKQVPVIIVSTEAEEKDRIQALQSGANFYMVKPVKPEELKKYVRILIGVLP